MPYSILIAQIENPITACWQCSQLYNFTALCFPLWSNMKGRRRRVGGVWPQIIRQGCCLISIQIRPSYPWKVLHHIIKFVPFFPTHVTNRIGQQFGMHLAASQGNMQGGDCTPSCGGGWHSSKSFTWPGSCWARPVSVGHEEMWNPLRFLYVTLSCMNKPHWTCCGTYLYNSSQNLRPTWKLWRCVGGSRRGGGFVVINDIIMLMELLNNDYNCVVLCNLRNR